MNRFMVIELIVFSGAVLLGLFSMFVLRRKLQEYDGMGEVKRKTEGRKRPPEKVL